MTSTKPQVFKSISEEETLNFGIRMAGFLRIGMTLAMYGDLGSGKTVLARGIARGLGITEPVTSPTFTVVQEYRTAEGEWLYHLDMYRITNEDEALAFGIDEYLFAPDCITLIEWPERIEDILHTGSRNKPESPELLSIYIEHKGPEEREITIVS